MIKHYPELEPIRQNIQGKRIAIVGNAESIFNEKNGKEIDKHDFIIRFNRGFIIRPECQGTKTDFLITACPLTDLEISSYNAKYTANRSGSYHSNCNFTINNEDRWIMANGLGVQPSTGFMAINICLYFGAKSIDLYGFAGNKCKTFYNDPNYITQHNYDKEQEVIMGYIANGLVNMK